MYRDVGRIAQALEKLVKQGEAKASPQWWTSHECVQAMTESDEGNVLRRLVTRRLDAHERAEAMSDEALEAELVTMISAQLRNLVARIPRSDESEPKLNAACDAWDEFVAAYAGEKSGPEVDQ
jgi:hypothetical protein